MNEYRLTHEDGRIIYAWISSESGRIYDAEGNELRDDVWVWAERI